jgi:putative ABC transport system ATP-binding protein
MTTVEDTPVRGAVAARVVDLTKVYGSGNAEVRALDGVTLDIATGEFTAVMGPSGSGKSTLMHICAALDTPTSGQIWVGDTPLGGLSDKKLTLLRREEIGFVFQSFNLVPTLSARENILLPLSIAGQKPDPAWYDAVIDTIKLRDRLDHQPNQLSGGQQQRVAIARSLAMHPQVMLLDEITSALDPELIGEVLDVVRDLKAQGMTMLFATHEMAFAREISDRVCFLDAGRIVESGPPDQVLGDPTEERTRRFLQRVIDAGRM